MCIDYLQWVRHFLRESTAEDCKNNVSPRGKKKIRLLSRVDWVQDLSLGIVLTCN